VESGHPVRCTSTLSTSHGFCHDGPSRI
jgi:hypothetical protein